MRKEIPMTCLPRLAALAVLLSTASPALAQQDPSTGFPLPPGTEGGGTAVQGEMGIGGRGEGTSGEGVMTEPGQETGQQDQQPQPAPQQAQPQAQGGDLSEAATDPGLASEGGLERPEGSVGDWLPPAIEFPEDMQVVIDSAVGSSTRLLQFSTREDAEALIARWRDALRQTGWQVDPSPEMIENQQILFSGPGIGSAQVIIIPSQSDGAQVIQIDASLNLE